MKELYINEQIYLTGGIVPSVYSICIDNENKIVHILDLNRIGTKPVIDSFSNRFAEQMFEQINSPMIGNFTEYQFYIYTTEGLVTKWNNHELTPLTHLDQCRQEFVGIMKERSKDWPKFKALYRKKE